MVQNISFNNIYNSLTTSNEYSIIRKQTKQFSDEKAVSQGELAKDLRNKCRALAKSDYSSGATTNIMTKLAGFIDSYNKLVSESENSTDRAVNKQLKSMQKLIEDNKAALKKAGINIEDDKKLKLNSETLTKLKSDSKFKSLFGGSNSFITSMQKCADKIYNRLKHQTVNRDISVVHNISLSDTNRAQALELGALSNDFNILSGADYSDSNRSTINSFLSTYVNKYNNYIDGGDNNVSSINRLITINRQYKNELADVGLVVNDDDSLTLDNDTFDNASMTNIEALFSKNNPYGSQTGTALGSIFSDIAGVSAKGLSVNIAT